MQYLIPCVCTVKYVPALLIFYSSPMNDSENESRDHCPDNLDFDSRSSFFHTMGVEKCQFVKNKKRFNTQFHALLSFSSPHRCFLLLSCFVSCDPQCEIKDKKSINHQVEIRTPILRSLLAD